MLVNTHFEQPRASEIGPFKAIFNSRNVRLRSESYSIVMTCIKHLWSHQEKPYIVQLRGYVDPRGFLNQMQVEKILRSCALNFAESFASSCIMPRPLLASSLW